MNFLAAENLANDRLVSTLFLATLFHGMLILGLSFNTGLFSDSELAPTLEVVLVNSLTPAATAPENSPYLALEHSLGAGNTEEKVTPASRATEPAPADSMGYSEDSASQQTREGAQDPTIQLLVTRSLSAFSLITLREADDVQQDAQASQSSEDQQTPLSDTHDETRIRDQNKREKIVSVTTRESDIAGYLAAWKRKIEQVGTLNFPALEQMASNGRNPVLEVSVKADGHLDDIIVRRSSQLHAVDEAAVQILRLASPFDPFPAHMQNKYDVLRFVYEWQFIKGVNNERKAAATQPAAESGV